MRNFITFSSCSECWYFVYFSKRDWKMKANCSSVENMHILVGFVDLKEICKEWKEEVEDMVKYSVLRLLIWGVGQVGVIVSTGYYIDIFFHQQYFWKLERKKFTIQLLVTLVENYQLTVPMKDLKIIELRTQTQLS